MQYQVTTAPTIEPLEVSDFEDEVRARSSADATLIERKIKAARRYVEEATSMALITQTVEAWFDLKEVTVPLWLPVSPIQSISSMATYDENGNATSISSSDYRIAGDEGALTYHHPARVYPVGSGWSLSRSDTALKIIYVAGFGAAGSNVPGDLLEAVYRVTLFLWKNREDQITGSVRARAIYTADDLLWPYMQAVA